MSRQRILDELQILDQLFADEQSDCESGDYERDDIYLDDFGDDLDEDNPFLDELSDEEQCVDVGSGHHGVGVSDFDSEHVHHTPVRSDPTATPTAYLSLKKTGLT